MLINMMSRKVPNQSFEVFIFAMGEGGGKVLKNKNTKQERKGEGKKTTPDIRFECREDELHKLGETLRHRGLFPGARLLISKSTGLVDPCWSRGVHGDAYSKKP